jgi:hypothetical protein
MMARRRNPFATILAHEWRDDSTPSKSNDETAAAEAINSEAIHSDWLDFLVIDAAGQGRGHWCMGGADFAAKAAKAQSRCRQNRRHYT